jgi:pimeloyl-ACP methyl ester carboxylesterase/tellurite resistance protein
MVDVWQRSLIFTDILRKRGNNYIRHVRSGQPPVLAFNFEIILNAKHFERPVNYALVRISERGRKDKPLLDENLRRRLLRGQIDEPKRPIVIIDPRAGHGPGIGGSKMDSEIGMALDFGHPVYFILFFSQPFPGQNLADVQTAMGRFLEKVAELHPDADRPAIMGNCQAGWAAALLCAERPDIVGPLVLNGAPLSYWSGVAGANPMRYRGGLLGGVWINDLLSDLGDGIFDGANLVANFESLNPANTYWAKQYNVFASVDTEEDRYLEFEKWWGGFFMLTDEEIHFIVDSLFVGNKLEKGILELRPGQRLSLKNIQSPILVFASRGDNITPPQQALNWIPRVYHSTDEIKRQGQVIVYMIHEEIGHLGIFVAGSVARREHNQIIHHFDMIDFMPPGLYEMTLEGDVRTGECVARFDERTLEDIAALDDGTDDEQDFSVVAQISEANNRFYRLWVQPWVRTATSNLSAEMLRLYHPLRTQRWMLSDLNPLMKPLKGAASTARANRKPAAPENPFMVMERGVSEGMITMLDLYRDLRDLGQEAWFQILYGSPLLRLYFPPETAAAPEETLAATEEEADRRKKSLEEGGLTAGLVRVMMAVARTGLEMKRRHFEMGVEFARTHKVLGRIGTAEFKRILKDQAAILQADEDGALAALSILIRNKADRNEALSLARRLCLVDGVYTPEEDAMIERIKKGLGL